MPASPSKSAVLNAIVQRLTDEVELYARAARAAHAEATDEQSRAENKYDTRGLEASYLARGQSRQAAETEAALAQFQALPAKDWPAGAPIDVGALVQLTSGKDSEWYFIGPRAGGVEVEVEGVEVTVMTPQSPLGSQLVGRKTGDRLVLNLGSRKRELNVGNVG